VRARVEAADDAPVDDADATVAEQQDVAGVRVGVERAVAERRDEPRADELLEQRKWDFFLAGFRMPDLIRYKKLYSKDLWPKGKMSGFTASYTQNYGSAECWPIGATEKNGNPNIP